MERIIIEIRNECSHNMSADLAKYCDVILGLFLISFFVNWCCVSINDVYPYQIQYRLILLNRMFNNRKNICN